MSHDEALQWLRGLRLVRDQIDPLNTVGNVWRFQELLMRLQLIDAVIAAFEKETE